MNVKLQFRPMFDLIAFATCNNVCPWSKWTQISPVTKLHWLNNWKKIHDIVYVFCDLRIFRKYRNRWNQWWLLIFLQSTRIFKKCTIVYVFSITLISINLTIVNINLVDWFSWWKYLYQHFLIFQCELNDILLLINYLKTSAQFHLWIMEKEKRYHFQLLLQISPLQKKVYSKRNENSSKKKPSNLLSSFSSQLKYQQWCFYFFCKT